MRAGGLNTLHALSVPDHILRVQRVNADALTDVYNAIQSPHPALRIIAATISPHLPIKFAVAPFSPTCSVIAVATHTKYCIAFYPGLNYGPRRAKYLRDCVWAAQEPFFTGDRTDIPFIALYIHSSIEDFDSVGKVIKATAHCLPALYSLRLILLAAPHPDQGDNAQLEVSSVAEAVKPIAERLWELELSCADDSWETLSVLPALEFAQQLVDAGWETLLRIVLPTGQAIMREYSANEWWLEKDSDSDSSDPYIPSAASMRIWPYFATETPALHSDGML